MATEEMVSKWRKDILYIMDEEALEYFDIKFSGTQKGFRFKVSSDGTLYENSTSGGIDCFGYPPGTKVSIVVKLDELSPSYNKVYNELTQNRGWGTGGISLAGNSHRDRSYSKDNFGVIRERFE